MYACTPKEKTDWEFGLPAGHMSPQEGHSRRALFPAGGMQAINPTGFAEFLRKEVIGPHGGSTGQPQELAAANTKSTIRNVALRAISM